MWRKLTILIMIGLGLAGGIERAGAASATTQAEQAVTNAERAVTNARRANAEADKAEKEGKEDAAKKRDDADSAAWQAGTAVADAQAAIDAISEGTNPKQKGKLQKNLDKLDAIIRVLMLGITVRTGPWLPLGPPPGESESEREKREKEMRDAEVQKAQDAINKLDPKDRTQLQKQLEELKKLLLAARPPDGSATLATLMAAGQVTDILVATGKTVGDGVLRLTLNNRTPTTLRVKIPSTVALTKGGGQPLATLETDATLALGENTVLLRGVCLRPDLPTPGNGEQYTLADPSSAAFPPQWRGVPEVVQAIFAAADKLQKEGAYRNTPYSEQETLNIVAQTATYVNTAAKAGTPFDATKHLIDVAYKQLGGAVTDQEKGELKRGIDAIVAAVQKTLEEARKAKPAVARPRAEVPGLSFSSVIQGEPTTIELSDPPRNLQKVLFYQEDKKGRKLIAEASRARGFSGCGEDPEVWRAQWVCPKADSVNISAWGLAGGKTVRLLSQAFKLDPPVKIAAPKFVDCVKSGPIRVEANLPAGSKVSLTIQRAAHYSPKGLPGINQHEAGDELTDGTDNEDFPEELKTPGALSCAPAAVASSLKWFAKNGYPKIVDEDKSDKDLVNDLGNRSDTGKPDPKSSGTNPNKMKEGVEGYLKDKGDFEVEVKENPTLEDICKKFAEGEDVTLWYRHRKYKRKSGKDLGHVVAVDDVDDCDKKQGPIKVRIMNPRNGKNEGVKINSDGRITDLDEDNKADPEAKLAVMLHISPKEKRGDFPPLHQQSYAGGRMVATVNLPPLTPGQYLLSLSATDKSGSTYTDRQLLFVNMCPYATSR